MTPVRYRAGTVVTEPGTYDGVHIETYHGQTWLDGPSVSSSGLRRIFAESPAHFHCHWSGNPDRISEPSSPAMTLGSAAHHLLLGEDHFTTRFVMRPEEVGGEPWQGNRKLCKAWLADQMAAGRVVLTPDQIAVIRGMAKSLAAHPLVQAGLLNGRVEQSMVWRCKDTGVWKKARPDCIPGDSGDFVDLKTAASVFDDDLRRTIYEHGYHQQGAMVCEGYSAITGNRDTTFTLVFVETKPPHCVRVITLTDEDLARGERQNVHAVTRFNACLSSGVWPGPGRADAEYMYLPSWAQTRIDFQLDQLEQKDVA